MRERKTETQRMEDSDTKTERGRSRETNRWRDGKKGLVNIRRDADKTERERERERQREAGDRKTQRHNDRQPDTQRDR